MDGLLPDIALRSPAEVMRLSRMGAAHPTRLSFMRVLLRRAEREAWHFERTGWDVDTRGVGRATYRVRTPERRYTLVAFAHDLPDDLRSDRVIAEAWDATFALYDGEPEPADLDRLAANVPLQEAGRFTERELTLSRANRSVRLFNHVVEQLAAGQQPAQTEIEQVGYLMRTTAVYGSAKFGLADRAHIAGRAELAAPFQAEMLTVWLIRAFTVDIVEHLAAALSPRAVRLSEELRHQLGVGNSTGLGMAPFLLNHPVLIHHWFLARETALARVRPLMITGQDWSVFRRAVEGAANLVRCWRTDHPYQQERLSLLAADILAITERAGGEPDLVWDDIWHWGVETLSDEGQELLLALMLEPHGEIVDALADNMSADEVAEFALIGQQSVGELMASIRDLYGWSLDIDWNCPESAARLWYVSEEKLEPRLAERAAEDLDPYEQPLGPARDVAALFHALKEWPDTQHVGAFLRERPEHRHTVRRIQTVCRFPYAEVRDNTLGAEMMPIDLLRAKLGFFGATQFDPRSDRWVRISMFRGAPYPDELGQAPMDQWMYAM